MELLGESISSQEQEKIVSFLARYLRLPIYFFSLHGVAGRVYFQSGVGKDRQLPCQVPVPYITYGISSFSLHGVAGRVYFQSGAGKDRQLSCQVACITYIFLLASWSCWASLFSLRSRKRSSASLAAVLWILIRMFLGLLDVDPLVRGTDLTSNKMLRKTLIPTVLRLLYEFFLS
jgi:hypothetical protein